jgi:hypothetical protein
MIIYEVHRAPYPFVKSCSCHAKVPVLSVTFALTVSFGNLDSSTLSLNSVLKVPYIGGNSSVHKWLEHSRLLTLASRTDAGIEKA